MNKETILWNIDLDHNFQPPLWVALPTYAPMGMTKEAAEKLANERNRVILQAQSRQGDTNPITGSGKSFDEMSRDFINSNFPPNPDEI